MCDIHVLDSDEPVERIDKYQRCVICDRSIIKSGIKWVVWNLDEDSDPSKRFVDIRSKMLGFTRIKRYARIGLDFSIEQKRFISHINARLVYWLRNPLIRPTRIKIPIYIPEYYDPMDCNTYLDL